MSLAGVSGLIGQSRDRPVCGARNASGQESSLKVMWRMQVRYWAASVGTGEVTTRRFVWFRRPCSQGGPCAVGERAKAAWAVRWCQLLSPTDITPAIDRRGATGVFTALWERKTSRVAEYDDEGKDEPQITPDAL